MSKKKRSKILATLLCATTMAAFYASPQIGYSAQLFNNPYDGNNVTTTGDADNLISSIEGLESITFGTGTTGRVSVDIYADFDYGGLRAEGALTVKDLYIDVENVLDSTNATTNGKLRYSLDNVVGLQREGTGLGAITTIENGGLQVSNKMVNVLEGVATFNNVEGQTDGGIINFDGKFNSEQGMTVGTDYTLDNGGNIKTTGWISAEGTINGNKITENTFNDVTLKSGEVTADEVTADEVIADGYKLTEVGSTLKTIDDKTKGIISYTPVDGGNTTFQGKITAYSGIVTNDVQTNTLNTTNIVSGTDRFTVHEAKEAIDWVDEWDTKVSGYDGRITQNETDIATLETTVGDENSGLVKDVNDLSDTVSGHTTSISSLTGRVDTAETDIDKLQKTVGDESSGLVKNVNDLNTTVSGHTTSINDLTGRVGTAETDIDNLQATVGNESSGLVKNVNDLNTTVSGHTTSINDLTGRVGTAETNIDTLQTTVGDENSGLVAKTKNLSADGSELTGMDNITTNTFTATSGSIGSIGFSGNDLTNVASIGGVGNTVTVAGTAISNGSFNSVSISNFTSGTGATINGISIYQDSDGHYNVGPIDLNDLTGSGSGGTVDGIVRTDNTLQDKEDNDYTTTIEGNLEVRTNGTITQRNGDFAVAADGTVTGKDFVIDSNTSLSGVAGDLDTAEGKIDTLQNATTGMSYNSGTGTTFNQVVNATDFKAGDITLKGVAADLDTAEGRININKEAISGLGTRVTTAEKDITGLKNKTHGFDSTGETLELTTINSTTGTVGGVTFNGGTATGLNTIGTAADTVTVAGTAISNGSFNGVNIGVDSNSHATFNGVSIYKDANDYIVGDVNISDLQGVSGTEIEGIKRTPNTGGGFTTTIEENLAVSTDGTIKQTKGAFVVDAEGTVTGKDFKVNGTSLGEVASAVNDQTKGLKATYDIASTNQAAITDEETGLGALNNKTTGMTYTAGTTTADGITEFDHKLKATAFETENLTATEGNIGGISFKTVNGVKTIGTDSDTITLAGNIISQGSFNGVNIGVDGSNHATFNGVSIYTDSANENDVMVGGINISDLQSGNTEITNKLKGITYSDESGNDYTMTFAGVMSVSTEGEYKFKYNGNEYGLDDLINTVSSEDLAGFEELKKKVDKLEDKTTGIEFDEGTGSTTINDMDKDSSGNWVKGDNSLTVGDDGITANGDTVINGDTDDNTTGGNGNDSNDPQGGDSIINGDQLVDGDQHVTGDSQFDGTITVGSGTDGKGQTVIDGGNITTGDTIIDGGSVTSKEGHFDNINVGSGENATTIGESGIQVGDNTTIDNSGVSIKDENGNVFMGDHDVVIKDSDGNVEASLSDVANRVDGIEQSIGDLNSRMGELEDRIDKVGAMAAAIANLRTMGYDPAAPTEVAVGIGQYRNETGAALGLFHYPNRDFMLSLSVSTSGDEVMGGIGATWKFGRKSPEKVAAEKAEKAREAKLQKAEAIKEAARLKKIEAQQERHAKLAAQKTATK